MVYGTRVPSVPKKKYYRCPNCSYYSRFSEDEYGINPELFGNASALRTTLLESLRPQNRGLFSHPTGAGPRTLRCLHCGNGKKLSKVFAETPPEPLIVEPKP